MQEGGIGTTWRWGCRGGDAIDDYAEASDAHRGTVWAAHKGSSRYDVRDIKHLQRQLQLRHDFQHHRH